MKQFLNYMGKNMPCEGRNKQVPSMIQPGHMVESVEWLPVPGLWVTILTPVAIWDKDINLNTSQADLKREVLIKCRRTLFPSSLPPLKPLALNLAKVSGCLWSPCSYIQQSVCMCKLLGRPQKLTPSFHKGLPHLPVKTGTSRPVIMCLPDAGYHHPNLAPVEYDSVWIGILSILPSLPGRSSLHIW